MSDTDTNAPQATDPVATDTPVAEDTNVTSPQINETPEATQAVEEKQTAEVKAEDTVEEKLYAGKYKSIEDLEKAYQNAESKLGQTTSEKAELAKILNEAFLTPEPQSQPQEDYSEESPVNPETDKLQRDMAVTKFILAHGDADAATMQGILKSDPFIAQINGHEAKLEYAYNKSQNMAHSQAIEEARKTSADQAQAKFAEKQAAQVETARAQTQPANDNEELTPSQLRETLKDDKSFDKLIEKKFPGISKMKTRR